MYYCRLFNYIIPVSEVEWAAVTFTTRWAVMAHYRPYLNLQPCNVINIKNSGENNVKSFKREIIISDFRTENLRNINQSGRNAEAEKNRRGLPSHKNKSKIYVPVHVAACFFYLPNNSIT